MPDQKPRQGRDILAAGAALRSLGEEGITRGNTAQEAQSPGRGDRNHRSTMPITPPRSSASITPAGVPVYLDTSNPRVSTRG